MSKLELCSHSVTDPYWMGFFFFLLLFFTFFLLVGLLDLMVTVFSLITVLWPILGFFCCCFLTEYDIEHDFENIWQICDQFGFSMSCFTGF